MPPTAECIFSSQHDTSSPLMVTPPSAEALWAVRVSDQGQRPSGAYVLAIYDVI